MNSWYNKVECWKGIPNEQFSFTASIPSSGIYIIKTTITVFIVPFIQRFEERLRNKQHFATVGELLNYYAQTPGQ